MVRADGVALTPVEFVHDDAIPNGALANIKASFSRGLPRFAAMPGLGHASGPVAIVGGGPSLLDTISELRNFDGPIISCGTVHDFLVRNSVTPDYHVDAEPDADGVMARWLRYPHRTVTYLLASQCPPAMFDLLKDRNVWLWHCALRNEGDTCFHGEPAIPGGCFNLARAWPLAAVMGHIDMHFFGFDCSFPQNCEGQHAYDYNWTLDEACSVQCGERNFLSATMWLAQLDVFMQIYRQARERFKITIHGDGLAAHVLDMVRRAAN